MDLKSLLTRRRLVLIALGVLIVAGIAALAPLLSPGRPQAQVIPVSELAQEIKQGDVTSIQSGGSSQSFATTRDGRTLSFQTGQDASLPEVLASLGVTPDELVQVHYTVAGASSNWFGLVLEVAPFLLFGAFLLFILRRSRGANNPFMSFGKSGARLTDQTQPTTTFRDVAGAEEPLQELQEVVEFLKYPEKFLALGARIPKGVLLVGPPGTGKTLLAKAVAGEAGVPFFSISGSEFVEMFVGVGASRVRDLFERAKRSAPCIVFVDEIDAVGRQRGSGVGGGNDEREQTLNQFLVEMDGFQGNTNVIVIAATNRPDVLDPALLRPGRFDRIVIVPAPDVRGRQAILDVHARGKPLDSTVVLGTLAKLTPGFSGADLANVLNEAAILAARRDRHTIGMSEVEEAIDRVAAGPERKSHVLSQQEKELTACHESGHVVVAWFLPHHDPVHKVTIVPRGLTVGHTRFLSMEDRAYRTRTEFADALAAMLGGQVAETLVFGEMSTGAGDDIERATSLARRMVKEYGMSDRLGPVAFGRKMQMAFLGREIGEQRNYSGKVGEAIDEEIRRLIDVGQAKALRLLAEHRDVLDHLTQELLRAETLDAAALADVFRGAASPEEEQLTGPLLPVA